MPAEGGRPGGGSRLPAGGPGCAVTVGTFDGVHRGHRAVLEELGRAARAEGLRALLVTFDPHPLRVIRPGSAPRLLTTPTEKKEVLAASALDYAVFLAFTEALSRLSPRRFVEEILLARLRMERLVIGYDHGLGRGRSGDVDTLEALGRELGFGVDVVEPVPMEGAPVSSTAIRRAVASGDLARAARGLGRPYSVQGAVVRGEGRGRALGFPTANIRVEHSEKLLPLEGVYAIRASWKGGAADGVLHLGPRPTFRGSPPSIEAHLFDLERDLYGQEVKVAFVERIRAVEGFATVESLVEAIREDCRAARAILARQGGEGLSGAAASDGPAVESA